MDKNAKAIETLVESILNIVDKKIAKLYCDKEAIVESSFDNVCNVIIDSVKYKVKNGTNIDFNAGDKCLVHYINGNQQNKVIIAKL